MSPFTLELLLHCYYSPAPFPRIGVPAAKSSVRELLLNDLIHPEQNGAHTVTEKGLAHVNQILDLPYPTRKWVGYNNKVINYDRT